MIYIYPDILAVVPKLYFLCNSVHRLLNDDIAKTVKQNPHRFVGLGTIPAQAPELAVEELKRLKADLQFPGIQIGSHINDWNLDAKELYPVWKTCEDLGRCLNFL